MSDDNAAPATKEDIRAVLAKLDGLATQDELAEIKASMATKEELVNVNRRLDLLNDHVGLILENVANNIGRVDGRLENHEGRIAQLEEGKKELMSV